MIETGLANKVVIVTGGSQGIGRATSLRFAREGAKVVAWDLSDQGSQELLDEIIAEGGQGTFQTVDVTQKENVQQAMQEIVDHWGGIDVLINNAGIVRDGQLVKWKNGEAVSTLSDADWDAVIDVNLKGVFLCTRAAVPHLIRRGGGVVLSASSVVGLYGNFGQTNYTATKGGLIAMTRTWARELGRYDIRVNAVAPGFIATDIVKAMPEKVLQGMIAHTPIRRAGEPEDIANAYVWLASDAASFVHGTVLSVDGGLVIGT